MAAKKKSKRFYGERLHRIHQLAKIVKDEASYDIVAPAIMELVKIIGEIHDIWNDQAIKEYYVELKELIENDYALILNKRNEIIKKREPNSCPNCRASFNIPPKCKGVCPKCERPFYFVKNKQTEATYLVTEDESGYFKVQCIRNIPQGENYFVHNFSETWGEYKEYLQ